MEMFCVSLKDLSCPGRTMDLRRDVHRSGNDQKENICTGRPGPARPNPRTPEELQTPAGMRTPVKHAGDAPQPEPWTPTANLKMLISAASPDIRQMRKTDPAHHPITCLGCILNAVLRLVLCQCDVVEDEEEGEDEEAKPSRKQRSLGLLCHRFLALYPDNPQDNVHISLDEVANSLGVERRRIYDIINVLESLTMVDRVAKNCYTWYGRRRLAARLGELQRLAHEQGSAAAPPREEEASDGDAVSVTANRKDKSLRIMSQRFVSLFLVSDSQCVTLESAAQLLIDHNATSHSKYKTKVRRLYDIANVLTSLALIRKVHVREDKGRKPAFQWLGPVRFSQTSGETSGETSVTQPEGVSQPIAAQSGREAKLTRHASFNDPPTCNSAHRLVNSAPCSPTSRPAGEDLLETMSVNAAMLYCLNNINFLLSASQSAAGLSLPTLALPYVLIPSYPVPPGDAHPSPLGFLSQANFLVGGAGPYGHLGAELGVTLAPPPPSSLEQSETNDATEQRPLVRQPPTPRTPKETTPGRPRPDPRSGGFFQTPRTLGSVVPATGRRRRGSAQRRLDVGHAQAS
ncbi:unnamed protein product [Lota lota]